MTSKINAEISVLNRTYVGVSNELNDELFSIIREGDVKRLERFICLYGLICLTWKKRANDMLPVFYAASIGAYEAMQLLCRYAPEIAQEKYGEQSLWETAYFGTCPEKKMPLVLALAAHYENKDYLDAIYSAADEKACDVLYFPSSPKSL